MAVPSAIISRVSRPFLQQRHLTIPYGRKSLSSRTRPLVMGIVNVTPDSFSDGGRYDDPHAAVDHGLRLVDEGADLIDVGGESTRPGAASVPLEEELHRVIPVIRQLVRRIRVPISIDTSKAEVARQAVEAGAVLINDVTALRGDPQMGRVAARTKAAVILMHMRGSPRTMQAHPRYHDVVGDVSVFLEGRTSHAQALGIDRRRIFIDPGIGFGKTVAHNLQLMAALDRFVALGYPVVVGPSRKSFIGRVVNAAVEDRLGGTLACVAQAARCGVQIVRVHDVRPVVQCVKMLEAIHQGRLRR